MLDKIVSEDLMISFGNITKNIHKLKREGGQSIVLVAVGMVALIAVIGLATDAVMIYKTKQDLQRAVDSAALAGAYKLPKKAVAIQATSEFMRLHGYNINPCGVDPLLGPCDKTNPYLDISFPNEAVQKTVHVEASTNAAYFFLRILGFNTMTVSAVGEGEAAPMDVYIIFDLSESMVYDTQKPSPWPPVGFTACSTWDQYPGNADCVAKYCNWARKCDPLDKYIKPAAYFFIDQLDPRYDRVGVVSYDQVGVNVIGLTSDFNGLNGVKAKIGALNAFDHQGGSSSLCPNTSPAGCNKQTNIGDGINVAHNNIALSYDPITKTGGGRSDSIWSMILLTDGKANVYRQCNGCPPDCGASACKILHLCSNEPCQQAEDWAINNATDTWTRHETSIYTIAYGTNSPGFETLMIQIADLTDGVPPPTENFFAAPDGTALQNDFLEIAKRIYSRLLH
jgi:hypothetical protein